MVSQVVLPSVMSFVPGPMDPITNRGLSPVAYRSHAARATSAAILFSARHWSVRPNSASTSLLAPKLSVSTQSAPTFRNDSWMSWITSGRVLTRMSVQFSQPQ